MSILENLLMLEEDYEDQNFNREDLDYDIHIIRNGKLLLNVINKNYKQNLRQIYFINKYYKQKLR